MFDKDPNQPCSPDHMPLQCKLACSGALKQRETCLAVVCIKAHILAHKSNVFACLPHNSFIVNLGSCGDLSKHHDLQQEASAANVMFGTPICALLLTTTTINDCLKTERSGGPTMPVLVHVSQATLLLGSSLRHASRIASETCEQAHVSRQPGGDGCFNLIWNTLQRHPEWDQVHI